jgi:hypothetical protein
MAEALTKLTASTSSLYCCHILAPEAAAQLPRLAIASLHHWRIKNHKDVQGGVPF